MFWDFKFTVKNQNSPKCRIVAEFFYETPILAFFRGFQTNCTTGILLQIFSRGKTGTVRMNVIMYFATLSPLFPTLFFIQHGQIVTIGFVYKLERYLSARSIERYQLSTIFCIGTKIAKKFKTSKTALSFPVNDSFLRRFPFSK